MYLLSSSFEIGLIRKTTMVLMKRKSNRVYAAVYFIVVAVVCRWTEANNFSCKSDLVQFKCRSDGKCIPKDWECDNDPDCADNSDEENCGTCDANEFSCGDKCIYKYWVCDGYQDCKDGADELRELCANKSCNVDEFMCVKSKKCIWKTWVCDYDYDCDDGSDEANCTVSECVGGFQCKNGKCIDSNWRCNHDYDCDDRSDEQNCTYKPCDERWEFQCSDKRCILKEAFCDNHYDCDDKSDEPEGCTSRNKCPADHFDCKDGNCIKMEWKCDGRVDCVSGDDEKTCTSTCREGEIRCQSKECIPKSLKCDGKRNCKDGSDENNCDPSLIRCKKGEFKCKTGRCISESLLCNGQNDCDNGEDESESCDVNECLENNGGCAYRCHDLKIGHRCSCREGHELAEDEKTCQDVDECKEFGKCSQICENMKNGYKCRCVAGYRLESKDRRTCKAIERNPYLVFSDHYSIRKLNLHKSRFFGIVRNLTGIIAVDYHLGENWMFWSDQKNSSIQRTSLHSKGGSGFVKETIITDVLSPDGIAVDWVTSKLYWTDAWKKRVEVSDVHGQHRRSLITTDIDMPRAIVVHPYYGEMFWTDWGNKPKIEKCGMDGDPTTRKAIITTKIVWPNALAIDYTINSIWWIDAKLDFIESCDLDGGNRRVILGQDSVFHPFSISVFEDHIYWSDSYKTAIYKANKFTGQNVTFLKEGLVNTLGISMIHPQRQPASFNFCQDNNGHCSHLCLLSAGKKPHYSCACPEGINLLRDNRTCNTSDALRCKKGMCLNGKCIPGDECGGPRCQCNKGYTGDRCEVVSENTNHSSNANAVTIGISVGVVAIIFIIFGFAGCALYKKIRKRYNHEVKFLNPVYEPTTDPIETNRSRGIHVLFMFKKSQSKKEPFIDDPDPADL